MMKFIKLLRDNGDGKPVDTVEFAKAPNMACCDGIVWREADDRIYVADMLINGVQAVDMNGELGGPTFVPSGTQHHAYFIAAACE